MKTLEKKAVFEKLLDEYDEWFDLHTYAFQSEVEAIRSLLPEGESHGIEVGLGSGRFAQSLGIKEGVEPSFALRRLAVNRGVEVMDAVAERLPYKALHFDFVLMASCLSYLVDVKKAFNEAFRVLRWDGSLIVGVLDKDREIAQEYMQRSEMESFYKGAQFYTPIQVLQWLREAGFRQFEVRQTLFTPLDEVDELQPTKLGYGEGSFVVIKARKISK
jgi:ubiquinone/menaquinone biosynthesis C-methylase UbiE